MSSEAYVRKRNTLFSGINRFLEFYLAFLENEANTTDVDNFRRIVAASVEITSCASLYFWVHGLNCLGAECCEDIILVEERMIEEILKDISNEDSFRFREEVKRPLDQILNSIGLEEDSMRLDFVERYIDHIG